MTDTYCELCGTAFVAGEGRHDYWWWNGGTAEKSHICNRCYSVVKRHIEAQTEPLAPAESLEPLDAPLPDDDINVVVFADDMPSPDKWEAAQKHIAMLNEEELVQQAGKVLEAIHLDHVAAYYGMGVYKARLRLEEILAELHLRIAVKQVAKRFKPMLEMQSREIGLYEQGDYDGLLREGFIKQEDYELHQRVKKTELHQQAIDHQTETQAPNTDQQADLLPNELTDDECEAMTLTIPGIGQWANQDDAVAIQALCGWADQYAVMLYLTAVPDKVVAFIEGLGFAGGGKEGEWVRDPEWF